MRSEDRVCNSIMRAVNKLSLIYPELRWFYHIDNEGRRKPWVSARKGIKAGVSDYMLPVSRGKYHGLFMEIKAPGKKPTEKQMEFLRFVEKQGYRAVWHDNCQDAIDTITRYLDGAIWR